MASRATKLILLVSLCSLAWAAVAPGVWLDVPFVRQAKDGCGAASLAMVMQYWVRQQGLSSAAADASIIQEALYTGSVHGIYASEMEHYLQQHAFRAFAFRGEWADLEHHLRQGRPLIVALKPPGIGTALHYVVVAGVNPEPQQVLVNDPAERKLLKRDWPTFEREWNAAGYWTLLALPQPDRP